MTVTLHTGDCLDYMRDMDANTVDSIVTDPPYGLSFMGKDWDHGVPGVPFWAEALRVAKPGAHLLAFGGTRTFHRLMVAIEDAGWEIRDTVMWLYGQGFPKSHNVSKAIDKMAGAEREVVGKRADFAARANKKRRGVSWADNSIADGSFSNPDQIGNITAPATPDAAKWDGWGTSLKPAWEPVIVARKPLEGTVAANVLAWGTGAVNVDASRIPTPGTNDKHHGHGVNYSCNGACTAYGNNGSSSQKHDGDILRHILDKLSHLVECEFPPSLLSPNDVWYALEPSLMKGFRGGCPAYHHFCDALVRLIQESDQVSETLQADVLECIHPCAHWDDLAQESLHIPDRQGIDRLSSWDAFRESVSSLILLCKAYTTREVNYTTRDVNRQENIPTTQGRWPANVILSYPEDEYDADGNVLPNPERDEVLAGFPVSVSRPVKPQNIGKSGSGERKGQTNGIGYAMGSVVQSAHYDTETSAARFFYAAKASRKDRNSDGAVNNIHPTCKPESLMRYLCKLVTRPGGVVFDPFMGSGSTGRAARLEGFNFIGIDLEAEYVEIARRRIEAAQAQPLLLAAD